MPLSIRFGGLDDFSQQALFPLFGSNLVYFLISLFMFGVLRACMARGVGAELCIKSSKRIHAHLSLLLQQEKFALHLSFENNAMTSCGSA